MVGLLEKIPYAVLIPIAGFMLLAPFKPMPHVLEKLIMLKEGALSRPLDIFDLCYHLSPLMLLVIKVWAQKSLKRNLKPQADVGQDDGPSKL